MAEDFSSKNLRDCSFKGQDLVGANFTKADLEGADFSYADLRSTNFTNAKLYKANFRGAKFAGATLIDADFRETYIYGADFTDANLTGADFSYTKAGLKLRWIIFLIAASGIINTSLGFSVYTAKEYKLLLNTTLLVLVGIFFLLTKLKNLSSSLKNILLTVAIAVILTGLFAGLGIGDIATAIIGSIFVTIPTLVVGFEVSTLVMAISVALSCSVGIVILAVTGVRSDTIGLTIGEMLASIFTSWRILARDKIFTDLYFISAIAIKLAAALGTSFKKANLTNAKFCRAVLSSTNFKNTKLTRTCWLKSQKLDWSFVPGSILIDSTVRNLLINEQDKSFVGLDLKGAYLAEMDLKEADFTEADLSEANLREAKLEEAIFVRASLQGANLKGAYLKRANFREANIHEADLQEADLEWANLNTASAEGTNFTKAKLSASCLGEVWITDSKTKLDQVDCKFFYILEDPKPGTDDRERQPSIDKYAEGEFEKIHRKIQNTVQIILRNGTSQEALSVAYQKVSEKDPGIRIDTIKSIDQAWKHILLTMEVTKGTDKKEVERIFSYFHELELKNQRLISYIQATNKYLKDKYPSVHIETYQHQVDIMSENSGVNINAGGSIGDISGIAGGDISAAFTISISKLKASEAPEAQELAKLLQQLLIAVGNEPELKKKEELQSKEQVQILTVAGENPNDDTKKKSAKTAIDVLRKIVEGLSPAAKLVEECNKLLPLISKLLGLS